MMKKFFVPAMLVVMAAVQGIRIQPISGEEIEHIGGAWMQPYQGERPRTGSAEVAQNESAEKRNSLDDYVIEPPDVITLTMLGGEFRSHDVNDITKRFKGFYQDLDKDGLGARRLVVAADGTVQLPLLGPIHVDGKTVNEARDEIETQLKRFIVEPSVRMTVAEFNSKIAYVIVQRGEAGDDVSRLSLPYPLTAEWNVGKALRSAVYPQPVDFSKARIMLKRPATDGKGAERVFPIAWDKEANKPTDETNHAVLPEDRIFLDCRGTKVEHSAPPAIPFEAPKSGYYTPAENSEAGMIQVHVAFVEDTDGALADIGELKQHGTMIGDSEMALSLLKILEKHKLVTMTGSPQLMLRLGQTGALEVGGSGDEKNGTRVSVESRRQASQVIFAVNAEQGLRERVCEIAMSPHQRRTIIMKLEGAQKDETSKGKSEPEKYVFVTAEVSGGPMVYSWSLAK
jgi:hypothetical protein